MNWLPIDSAPNDEQILLAYYGPDANYYGLSAVGHFFKWECMSERLHTGWPRRVEPTHWMPLPPPPEAES